MTVALAVPLSWLAIKALDTNMGLTDYTLPPQAWELQAGASAGLTISQFRFAVAFILSVVVGAILRKVPTVRGAIQRAGGPGGGHR